MFDPIKFLSEAAVYFQNRPINGEDRAYWSNVYNAANCKRIIDSITNLLDRIEDLELDNKIKQKEINMLQLDLDLVYDYDSNLIDTLKRKENK